MEYLTKSQLLKLAPGAGPRRDATKNKLLDTSAVLDRLGPEFRPVFALQGTTHEDSQYDAKDGRHLVVAARNDGVCYTLLNSHCRLLRVWIGMGLWSGEELLIYHTLPVQRWKGVEAQLEMFKNQGVVRHLLETKHRLRLPPTNEFRVPVAGKIAKIGYIEGRGRPSVAALVDQVKLGQSMLDMTFALVGVARRGNLQPSTGGGRRNVKGIRRPDALHHLAKVAYAATVEAL